MIRSSRPLVLALTAVAGTLAGCASLPTGCPASSQPTQWTQLAFGRSIGDQGDLVSEADFQHFVDSEITPRFPDGLTILDARGQWRGPDGRLVREPSKILLLALPSGAESLKKVDEIRAAYRQAFRQDSVMWVTQPACVAF
jgi:hypothetical protein